MSSECYPIKVLPHMSALYLDYLEMADSSADAGVRQWYGGEPFAGRWMRNGREASKRSPEHSNLLADLLDRQALEFGAGEVTRANIAKLRGGARAVVTGQQVALFGGPLLTILK